LIIAAPASGSGKTLVTLGLLKHLARKKNRIVSAKVGPDYIDPAFHAAATRMPCRNLDSWAMRPEILSQTLRDLTADGDLIICEGVMGLFDGARGQSDAFDGSTAALARFTGWPVILVVDASHQAASVAALVRGFAGHDPGVSLRGVIFNRVGSEAHAAIVTEACAETLPFLPVLGCLPRADGLELPSRHLGLVQAGEHQELDAFLERAADWVAAHLDLPALGSIFAPLGIEAGTGASSPLPPLGQRIAVARDTAFAFSYPHILQGWRDAGAEITFFSPLADEAPGADADAVYLPGGYPELHAGVLAAAGSFLGGLRTAAGRGASLFGECGGYMVLGERLIDAEGSSHDMAGLLALQTSFAERRLHLGYREVIQKTAGPPGKKGGVFRGHEFHYARIVSETGARPLFQASNAAGEDMGDMGLADGNVAGSFVHLIDRRD